MTKRMNEIKERKAALLQELDTADEARVAAISTEVETLVTEEKQIRSKMDLAGRLGNVVTPKGTETDTKGTSAEERGKMLLEKRAVTIQSTGVILPSYEANDIKPTFNEVSSLLDRVTVKPFMGGESFKQPYLVSYGEGGYTTEGGNPTDAEPTFAYAQVNKTKITAYAEDSEELTKLPAANYDGEVVKGISVAVRKKITKEILVGDGEAGHFVGIFDDGATAISAATDITFASIDEETLDTIIYTFGGSEDVEDISVLVLNKLDLKAFAMLRDANGRKIHDVKPRGNVGTIDGVPYIINSNCKAITASTTTSGMYSMCYGPLSNYTMAIFSDLEVARSTDYKFKEGMIAHRGVIFAGGNVTARNGFLRVKRT